MTQDLFNHHAASLISPPTRAFDIAPDDDAALPLVTRGLMVGATGNVQVETLEGDIATLRGLQPGVQYAMRVRRVLATGTSATDILGLS